MFIVDEDNLDDVQPEEGQVTEPVEPAPEPGQPQKGKEPDRTAKLADAPEELLKKTHAELTKAQQLNATLQQRLNETEKRRNTPPPKPKLDYDTEMADIQEKLAAGEIDANKAMQAQGKLMNALRQQDKDEVKELVTRQGKETTTYAERQIFLANIESANPEVAPYAAMIEGEARALLAQGEQWEDAILKSVDKVKKLIGKATPAKEPTPQNAPPGSQAIMRPSSVPPPPKDEKPEDTGGYIDRQKKRLAERKSTRR